jgi:hypothetical protein
MALWDLFTGQPAIEAAGQARGTLQGAQGNIGNLADLTRRYNEDALRGGYSNARGDLSTGYGASTGAINAGAGSALGYLDQGQQGAMGSLAQARGDLTANGGAYAPLSALASRYAAGGNTYADSLGLNGPEGNTRAVGAFQAGPGYQFALDQGIDAVTRNANARGRVNSGNTDVDLLKYGTGLANQEYGNWQNRLKSIGDQELQATQGAAAGNQANNTTLAGLGVTGAGLQNAGGVNRAGIATGQGQNLADIARTYYGGQAGLDTGEAGALAGNMNNTSGWMVNSNLNLAPQVGKTFQDEAQAALTGQKNAWGLGMQGAQALAGMGGGGSSFLPSMSFLQNGLTSGPGSQGVW